jgi:hypothetical protein
MADPSSSKSRILAALDLTEDDPSPSTGPPLPTHIFSQHVGQKRKRAADYSAAVAGPVNKRLPSRLPRTELNRLPTGLLANTPSPGEHLSFTLEYLIDSTVLIARCRRHGTNAHSQGTVCSRNTIYHHLRVQVHFLGPSIGGRVSYQ